MGQLTQEQLAKKIEVFTDEMAALGYCTAVCANKLNMDAEKDFDALNDENCENTQMHMAANMPKEMSVPSGFVLFNNLAMLSDKVQDEVRVRVKFAFKNGKTAEEVISNT